MVDTSTSSSSDVAIVSSSSPGMPINVPGGGTLCVPGEDHIR